MVTASFLPNGARLPAVLIVFCAGSLLSLHFSFSLRQIGVKIAQVLPAKVSGTQSIEPAISAPKFSHGNGTRGNLTLAKDWTSLKAAQVGKRAPESEGRNTTAAPPSLFGNRHAAGEPQKPILQLGHRAVNGTDWKYCTSHEECLQLQERLKRTHIFAVDRPDVRYLLCAIPKNGCTYHMGLVHRIYGESSYETKEVVHNKTLKQVFKLSNKSPQTIASMITDETLPKYAVVRNPLMRTLSAYLNKVETRLPIALRTIEHFHRWTYENFPLDLPKNFKWRTVNPHWKLQVEVCGFSWLDTRANFSVFRVEEPAGYAEFLYKTVPHKYLRDGWGRLDNRSDSFRDYVTSPRTRTVQTHIKFDSYFSTLGLFDHLAKALERDIKAFGYEQEIKLMREKLIARVKGRP